MQGYIASWRSSTPGNLSGTPTVYVRCAYILHVSMTQDRHRLERFLPLPPAWLDILLALCTEDLHGYAVMQEVARTADTPLHPGTLYRALARLLESELIVELDARAGRRRASPLPRDRPAARSHAPMQPDRTGRGPAHAAKLFA
jgi:hypothetical protein